MNMQKKILEIRTNQKLTQDEFAEKLNVTRQAVSRWENGDTTPTIDTLKQIAETFRVDVCEIIGIGATCQSCSWPLNHPDYLGFHADGAINPEYCGHCYREGKFSAEKNVAEMAEKVIEALEYFNQSNNSNYTEEEARKILNEHIATLKRWKSQ